MRSKCCCPPRLVSGAAGRRGEFLAVSDGRQAVLRPVSPSAPLTSPPGRASPSRDPVSAGEVPSSSPVPPPPPCETTRTRKTTRTHTCARGGASLGARSPPLGLSLCLPPSLTHYSVYAVTLTPPSQLQPQPFPLTSRDCCFLSPPPSSLLGVQRFSHKRGVVGLVTGLVLRPS